MSSLLDFASVSLTYQSKEGETEALKNVTFSVKQGEFAAIIGPSGSGKTTVLSLLAKLIAPSSGEIFLCGKPIRETKNIAALMPQRDQLFEWRTVLRNVNLGLEINKSKTREATEYAAGLLKKYGLWDFRRMHPSALSGGMRQRAALIRTLVTRPELLLLDEPFSALDYQTRLAVCDDVYSIIKQENKTAILVTHDVSEAISMADKVIVLSNRPAVVADIIETRFDGHEPPHGAEFAPLARRERPEFAQYFNKLLSRLKR